MTLQDCPLIATKLGESQSARFGSSVAIDGTVAIIGAPGAAGEKGKAYVYNLASPPGFPEICVQSGEMPSA